MAEVYVHMKIVNLRPVARDLSRDARELEQLGKLAALEQQLLGYIEVLTEKTKELMKNPAGGKTEEGEDWKSICDIAEDKADKSFDDVVGMAEQKRMAITSFIKPLLFPNVFPALGKGVLLYGPPGTGKTYFVKGMINALQTIDKGVGILYYAPTAADLKGKYVGETEKKIVKYFTCASRNACVRMEESLKEAGGDVRKAKKYISVIFIDEFDGVGGDRSEDQTGLVANSVNTLLQMMDGVQSFKILQSESFPYLYKIHCCRMRPVASAAGNSFNADLSQILDFILNLILNLFDFLNKYITFSNC
jgi:SpoVK/Ycf46/Vps4 family AAA+-type ATPase